MLNQDLDRAGNQGKPTKINDDGLFTIELPTIAADLAAKATLCFYIGHLTVDCLRDKKDDGIIKNPLAH